MIAAAEAVDVVELADEAVIVDVVTEVHADGSVDTEIEVIEVADEALAEVIDLPIAESGD